MNWKNKLTNALAATALLLVSATAHAGIYTWSAPTAISTAETTLGQSGTIIGAAVFGNDAKLVVLANGTTIHFTTDGSVATATGNGTAYGGFTNNTGNAAFNAVLTQFNYDGGPKTITLNNLVVGQQYSVQLFACDRRDGIAITRVGNYQDPNDAGNVSANFQMGDYAYVIGTFTAGNTSESIQMNLLNSNGGNINALVLRAIGTNVPPQITVQPQPAAIYNGLKASLVAGASGTGPISYQWQKGAVGSGIFTNLPNGGTVSGATSNQMTITSLAAGNTGDYRVIATSAYGSATSTPPATLTVLSGIPKFAWSEPTPVTTAEGALIKTGTIVGAAVFGATETTVTLTNSSVITFKVDGSVAAVTVGGFGTAAGAFTGNTGNANFNSVLDQFNYDGGPKTISLFNLVVGQQYAVQLFAVDTRTGGGGEAPFRLVNFQDPNDANNVSSTFAQGDVSYLVGTFYASNSTVDIQQNLLNGGNGNINALVVRLLGVAAPQIATQPQGDTLDQTLSKTFTVVATGTAPLSYQWKRGAIGSGIYTNVPTNVRYSGLTSATLTITNLAVGDTADYVVMVSNLAGSVTSAPPATLTVQPVTPLYVWSQPTVITTADTTLNQSGSVIGAQVFGATPKVVVLGNGTSIDFKNDGVVATATGAGTFAGAYSGNTGNGDFNAVLNQANYDNGPKTITLNNLVIGQQYAVQLFALDNRGGASTRRASYQNPADGDDHSATFTMGDNFYVLGTFTANNTSMSIQQNLPDGGGGNINALVLRRLTGLPVAPQITTVPTSKNAYTGSAVQFTVGANGSSLAYQWQRGAVGSGIFTNISNGGSTSGATTAQLNLSSAVTGDTADYRVVISNGAGSATSAPPAKLTVYVKAPATLIHRWAFNETSGTTAADSIGGANGTLVGGGASFDNGMLFLNNPSPQTTGAGSYVSIPGGLVSGLTAVTFQGWITNSGLNNGNTLIGFGGPIDGFGAGTNFINFFLRWTGSQNAFQIKTYAGDSGVAVLGTRQQNGYFHWALAYDPIPGTVALYLNGNLFASASGITVPLSTVGNSVGYIGYSAWDQGVGTAIPGTSGNFPYYNGRIDEVRIYNGVLTAAEITATQLLGANQLLSNAATLSVSNNAGNINLTWPLVNGGFTLEASPTVGAGAVWTPVSGTPTVVGSNYRMIVGSTNSAAFFRLKK